MVRPRTSRATCAATRSIGMTLRRYTRMPGDVCQMCMQVQSTRGQTHVPNLRAAARPRVGGGVRKGVPQGRSAHTCIPQPCFTHAACGLRGATGKARFKAETSQMRYGAGLAREDPQTPDAPS